MISINLHVKKRTIIATIITIAMVLVTNKYWLDFKPMPVNFDILGSGTCNIKVQFNKKDNNEFKKVKDKSIKVDLDKSNKVKISVNNAKYPKRIRFAFSGISSQSPIIVSNIELRNGKFKIDNIEKFEVEGADRVNKDNKLILTPKGTTIILTYPDTLKVRAGVHFDFMLFTIILILTYLSAYKLSDYIADFNTVKGKSRIKIIFLTIFFAFLFVPMSHINQDEKSIQENRTLAAWKPLITENNKINYNFGKDFNEWFNDRFNLRYGLISVYTLITHSLSTNYYETNTIIVNKKAGFIFTKATNWLFLHKNLFMPEELSNIKNNIAKLNEYCKKNKIELFIVISHDKESYYPEFYPTYYIKPKTKSRTDQVIDELNSIKDLNIIVPKDDLLELKNTANIILKTDTHNYIYNPLLNHDAYRIPSRIGYEEFKIISRGIQKKIKDFSIINVDKIEKVSLKNQHGHFVYGSVLRNYYKDDYEIYVIKNPNAISAAYIPAGEYSLRKYENKNCKNNKRVLLIGDSFTGGYSLFLAESVRYLDYLFFTSSNTLKIPQEIINELKKDKPDIIVIESVERNLHKFKEINLNNIYN